MTKRLQILLLAVIGSIILNFSSDNPSKSDKTAINFYGTVTTNSGNRYNVDNITISGLYSDIPIYAKPLNKQDDPKIDLTRLNLADITAIVRQDKKLTPPLKFNHREYIEIQVIWKDKSRSQENYIIERNKQIICNETSGSKPKKEISLETISRLEIIGFKHRSEEDCNKDQITDSKTIEKISNNIEKLNNTAAKVSDQELKKTLLTNIDELKKELESVR